MLCCIWKAKFLSLVSALFLIAIIGNFCGILVLQFIDTYFYLAVRKFVYEHECKLFAINGVLPSFLN